MKTITKTVYTFRELLDIGDRDAQERARTWLAEINTDWNWYELVYGTWKEALEEIGFITPVIHFRGFGSQGDGASFTAPIDIACLARFLAPRNPKYSRLARLGDWLDRPEVRRTSYRYCHENTCTTTITVRSRRSPAIDHLLRQFTEDVEIARKKLCKAIYRDLETEYEYLISDEALLQLADANDYLFTIDGKTP